jgi:hypothetical protein
MPTTIPVGRLAAGESMMRTVFMRRHYATPVDAPRTPLAISVVA